MKNTNNRVPRNATINQRNVQRVRGIFSFTESSMRETSSESYAFSEIRGDIKIRLKNLIINFPRLFLKRHISTHRTLFCLPRYATNRR